MPSAEGSAATAGVVCDLLRGINVAGVLDRRDDHPGWSVGAEDLAAIADAGFSAVRLPVPTISFDASPAMPEVRITALRLELPLMMRASGRNPRPVSARLSAPFPV